MTSWHMEPGEDFDRYEREDPITPEQALRDLEDEMERPYGGRFAPRPSRPLRMPVSYWHERQYGPMTCAGCKTETDEDSCPTCGGTDIARRVFIEQRGAA